MIKDIFKTRKFWETVKLDVNPKIIYNAQTSTYKKWSIEPSLKLAEAVNHSKRINNNEIAIGFVLTHDRAETDETGLVVLDFDTLSSTSLSEIERGSFTYRLPFPCLDYMYEYSASKRGLHIYCEVSSDVLEQLADITTDTRDEYANICKKIEVFTDLKPRFIRYTGFKLPKRINLYASELVELIPSSDVIHSVSDNDDFSIQSKFVIEDEDILHLCRNKHSLYTTGVDTTWGDRLDQTPSGHIFSLLCSFVRYSQDFEQITRLVLGSYTARNSSWGNPDIADGSNRKYPPKGRWFKVYKRNADGTVRTIGENNFQRAYNFILSNEAFVRELSPITLAYLEHMRAPADVQKLSAVIKLRYDEYAEKWSTEKKPYTYYLDTDKLAEVLISQGKTYNELPQPFFDARSVNGSLDSVLSVIPPRAYFDSECYVYDYQNSKYVLPSKDDTAASIAYTQMVRLFPTSNTGTVAASVHTAMKHLLKEEEFNVESDRVVYTRDESLRKLQMNNWVPAELAYRNSNPVYFACQSGVVNIQSGEIYPLNDKFFYLHLLPFDITFEDLKRSPEEVLDEAPTWKNFLTAEFSDDVESILSLQRYMGYCLYPSNPVGKGLFLTGATKSGKSTVVHVLTNIFGLESVTNVTLNSFNSSFVLGDIAKMRVFAISEMHKANKTLLSFVEPLIKQLTSPADLVQENQKYKKTRMVKPMCKTVLVGNEIPRFSDSGQAMSERFIYINFPVSFAGKEDENFLKKINIEMKWIFLWVLHGYKDFLASGKKLIQASSGEIVKTHIIESAKSSVETFIESACIRLSGEDLESTSGWESKDDLYVSYKRYCECNGYSGMFSKQKFVLEAKTYLMQNLEGGTTDANAVYRRNTTMLDNGTRPYMLAMRYIGEENDPADEPPF